MFHGIWFSSLFSACTHSLHSLTHNNLYLLLDNSPHLLLPISHGYLAILQVDHTQQLSILVLLPWTCSFVFFTFWEYHQIASCQLQTVSVLVAQPFATSWAVAPQAPLSIEFSRQEYWSGQPFPSPGELPYPGIELKSPALQADPFPSEPPGNPQTLRDIVNIKIYLEQLN